MLDVELVEECEVLFEELDEDIIYKEIVLNIKCWVR